MQSKSDYFYTFAVKKFEQARTQAHRFFKALHFVAAAPVIGCRAPFPSMTIVG